MKISMKSTGRNAWAGASGSVSSRVAAIAGLSVAIALAAPTSAAEIPAGMAVVLRMEHSVSSRTAHTGDRVYLRTDHPVIVNGEELVPEQSYVVGEVTRVKRPGRLRGKAQLEIEIATLILADGRVIALSPHIPVNLTARETESGRSDGDKVLRGAARGLAHGFLLSMVSGGSGTIIRGGMGIGYGAGAVAGILARGKEVEIQEGSLVDLIFDRSVAVP